MQIFLIMNQFDYTAIIVIEYSGRYFYKKFFVYSSGVELLTNGLKELSKIFSVSPLFLHLHDLERNHQ